MTSLVTLRRRALGRSTLSDTHVRTLRELARWPDGMPSINGVAPAGTLANLEHRGLAERLAPDAIGNDRFRLTAAGVQALKTIGDAP